MVVDGDEGGVDEEPVIMHQLRVQCAAAEGTVSLFGPSLTLNNKLIKIYVLLSLLARPLLLTHHLSLPGTPSLHSHQSRLQVLLLVHFQIISYHESLTTLVADVRV